MNPHYNQQYTKEEIHIVLDKIKTCVGNNRYTIAFNENRKENIDFINETSRRRIYLDRSAFERRSCYERKKSIL